MATRIMGEMEYESLELLYELCSQETQKISDPSRYTRLLPRHTGAVDLRNHNTNFNKTDWMFCIDLLIEGITL